MNSVKAVLVTSLISQNYFTFLCQYIGKMPDRAMDRVIMLIQTDRLTFEVDFQLFFVLKWTFSFGGHMDVNC